mmetsp:Transcript_18529/g.60349  ORF Transcript_18529/g.60349 Transcript_18529/m.60349 type:complete len:261 (+) Transcript_18529:743-1525(+)
MLHERDDGQPKGRGDFARRHHCQRMRDDARREAALDGRAHLLPPSRAHHGTCHHGLRRAPRHVSRLLPRRRQRVARGHPGFGPHHLCLCPASVEPHLRQGAGWAARGFHRGAEDVRGCVCGEAQSALREPRGSSLLGEGRLQQAQGEARWQRAHPHLRVRAALGGGARVSARVLRRAARVCRGRVRHDGNVVLHHAQPAWRLYRRARRTARPVLRGEAHGRRGDELHHEGLAVPERRDLLPRTRRLQRVLQERGADARDD